MPGLRLGRDGRGDVDGCSSSRLDCSRRRLDRGERLDDAHGAVAVPDRGAAVVLGRRRARPAPGAGSLRRGSLRSRAGRRRSPPRRSRSRSPRRSPSVSSSATTRRAVPRSCRQPWRCATSERSAAGHVAPQEDDERPPRARARPTERKPRPRGRSAPCRPGRTRRKTGSSARMARCGRHSECAPSG
jgi:hypothetical protein